MDTKTLNKRKLKDLLEIIVQLESTKEAKSFLADLCTPGELQALHDRWQVVQMINEGISYREIAEKTKVSTATITRVGRSLKYGEGGYKWALETKSKES